MAKRVVITKRGGPEVLAVVEGPAPEPGPGQVRIRVAAAGVAFADLLMREGLYPNTPRPPFTPGYDVVGTVDRLGAGVSGMAVGDTVAALTMVGGYAEYICVDAQSAVRAPQGVDAAEAVALVLNFLTAYQMLHRCVRIEAGERALIHGAGGGVGDALLQLGRLGKIMMLGTASAGKHEAIQRLGATPIDYHKEDFVARVREITGDGVDVVFDAVGGRQWKRSFRALRAGGLLVGYGFSAATVDGRRSLVRALAAFFGMPRYDLLHLMTQTRGVMGYNVMTLKRGRPQWYREDLAALLRLLAERQIQPHIAERVPLAEATRAHELLGRAAVTGKIVLVC
jgi:NADPH:quinone reductase-like Zn-dependent oxidoreductase